MNKVVFIAGILTVCVVGGVFFCAGLFMSSYVVSKPGDNKVEPASKTRGEDVLSTLQETTEDVKQKGSVILDKIADLIPGKSTARIINTSNDSRPNVTEKDEEITRSTTNINIDNLLNEIVSGHDTSDQCLTENVKYLNKEPIVMNNTKKYMIFVGYFENNMCNDIAQLMMAKGYPIHTQRSGVNNAESYMFCGPFKKKLNAQKILTWLNGNGFQNAKLVSQDTQKPEEISLEEFDDAADAVPINADFRRHSVKDVKVAEINVPQVANNVMPKNDEQQIKSPNNVVQKRFKSQSVKKVIEDDLEEVQHPSGTELISQPTLEDVSPIQTEQEQQRSASNDNLEEEEEEQNVQEQNTNVPV